MSGKLEGRITQINEAGDLVSDITADQLADVPRDDRTAVRCDGHLTIGIHAADHGEPEMTLLALINDDNLLALTIVGDSAKIMLGVAVGTSIEVEWQ